MILRNVPLPIQNQLKKDSRYGCSICGCPLLEFVQIDDSVNDSAFLPEKIITACPAHTKKITEKEFSRDQLFDLKLNPHNLVKSSHSFGTSSDELTINIAKIKFVNTFRVISVDDFDLVIVRKENNFYLVLDINFLDAQNNLISIVSENSWTADRRQDWTIDYARNYLKIHNPIKGVSFEARINSNEIFITAEIFYNCIPISITNEHIFLGGTEVKANLKGTTLKNYDLALGLQTKI